MHTMGAIFAHHRGDFCILWGRFLHTITSQKLEQKNAENPCKYWLFCTFKNDAKKRYKYCKLCKYCIGRYPPALHGGSVHI